MFFLIGYMVAVGYSRDGCLRSGCIHLWSSLLWLVEPRHSHISRWGDLFMVVAQHMSSSAVWLFIDHVDSFGIVIKEIIYIHFVFLLFLYITRISQ